MAAFAFGLWAAAGADRCTCEGAPPTYDSKATIRVIPAVDEIGSEGGSIFALVELVLVPEENILVVVEGDGTALRPLPGLPECTSGTTSGASSTGGSSTGGEEESNDDSTDREDLPLLAFAVTQGELDGCRMDGENSRRCATGVTLQVPAGKKNATVVAAVYRNDSSHCAEHYDELLAFTAVTISRADEADTTSGPTTSDSSEDSTSSGSSTDSGSTTGAGSTTESTTTESQAESSSTGESSSSSTGGM